MLIGQLSDIHIGFDRQADPDTNPEENLVRLRAALARIAAAPQRPELLLLTGDLTEWGDATSYATLVATLAPLGIPCWPIPGNHDLREPLVAAFPQVALDDGFIHYAIALDGLRILMLDTFEPGRHGGAFCAARAKWLSAQLAAYPDTPTLIAMHHPPFATGVAWMDPNPDEPWLTRFADAIAGHSQILAITSGHVHRSAATQWHGHTAVICPSSAAAVALDFSPIDPAVPDNRVLITDEPPGFVLHQWDGVQLTSHILATSQANPLARYNAGTQGMIAGMFDERPGVEG
ncbi:MAG: metallophosphoesterase [Pseudomonadota bacterium]|nr:metallophosphoesterase [Pseudomonadota bacterium]